MHRREVYEAVVPKSMANQLFGYGRLRLVQAIRDRYRGGESIASLARDYGLSKDRIKIVVETVKRRAGGCIKKMVP